MTKKRIAFIFPGQGAQVVGMGKDFYERYPSAREVFQQGDEILERALTKIIFEGPLEVLTETRNSQTAIYLNSMAILRVIQEQFPDLEPVVCAGLSLGEYTAMSASGRIPFESCLPLVQFRGEAMNRACEATEGTMAVLLGLPAPDVEALVKEIDLPNDLWVANFNCPGQTVISGTQKGVEAGMAAAKERGAKRAMPLKVHGAFHSGLMKRAEEELAEKINQAQIAESSVGIVMNVSGDFVTEREMMRRYLIEQVTSPVRWEQGICSMMDQIDLFVEIGCGRTLAGMNRQMKITAPTVTVSTVDDLEKLAEVLGQ